MKVRDLIKDTVWLPNDARPSAPPVVSVLWPSYGQEGDRLFVEAAQSILDQTLTDIELIIVDDATSASVNKLIRTLMAEDPRVSCLRHPRNIGLPAISEFEAFTRARGKYLAFAFDDFVFDRLALSRLVNAAEDSPGSAVHGFAEWFDEHDRQHFYGKDAAPLEGLKFHNFLCNSSFLVPRSILEDVGLYDPHVAATRLCDWDLWRRIQRKYPILRVPVRVGREHGNTRPGSLGKSYPLIEEAMQEFFGIDRDALLRSPNFPDRDVWQLPATPSCLLTTHVITLRRFFSRTRDWARGLSIEAGVPTITTEGRPIIGIFGPLSPLTPLIFGALHDYDEYRVVYVFPHRDDSYLRCCLAQCSIIIIAEDPFDPRSEYALRVCSLLNIPTYYLHDHAANFAFSSLNVLEKPDHDKVAAFLRGITGSLCSSRALAHRLREKWPHHKVFEIPVAFDQDRKQKLGRVTSSKTGVPLHIGLLGEQQSDIQPLAAALQRLSSERPIQVHSSVGLKWPRLSLSSPDIADSLSCDEFLIRWKQRGTDVLIVTVDIESVSVGAVLLLAYYLESVLVLTGRPACELGREQGVLWADEATGSYERALALASDPEVRPCLIRSLGDYCARTLAPHFAHVALTKLLEGCPTASAASLTSRFRALLIATPSSEADPTARAALVGEAALTLAYSNAKADCLEPPPMPAGISRGSVSMPRMRNMFDVNLDRGGNHVFGVPAGTSAVRLLSEQHMAPGDGRKLGAAIARITIDGRPIPLSDPSLVTGFHRDEGNLRWTDGAGILPVLVQNTGSVLEIDVWFQDPRKWRNAFGQADPVQQPQWRAAFLRRVIRKIQRILVSQKWMG